MDVMDAGVWVAKWEADVPRNTKLVLWGPLQAKEMGLDGWQVQDGGETGFVLHDPGTKLTMGRATSTLIFVRRLEKAYLTVYFGGYPADARQEQRHLDMQKVVSASEMFLTRLSKQAIKFQLQGEMTLVDNVNDASVPATPVQTPLVAEPQAAPAREPGTIPSQVGTIVDGEPVPRRAPDQGRAEVWEV